MLPVTASASNLWAAATAPPPAASWPHGPSGVAPGSANGAQSRDISGRVGLQPAQLLARRTDDVVRLDGVAAGRAVSAIVKGSAGERRISGSVDARAVDLETDESSGVTRLQGSVGNDDVLLEAASYGPTQVNVSGHVGVDTVRLYVYRQIDGNVVDGFAGGRRVSFRDRDIEGRLQGLDPLDYVALLVAATRK